MLAKNGSRLLLINGNPEEERSIREIDSAVAAIQLLSPLVDDLASDLPAPLCQSQTKKQASGCNTPTSLLQIITRFLKILG